MACHSVLLPQRSWHDRHHVAAAPQIFIGRFSSCPFRIVRRGGHRR
jgi:hypothetical protein